MIGRYMGVSVSARPQRSPLPRAEQLPAHFTKEYHEAKTPRDVAVSLLHSGHPYSAAVAKHVLNGSPTEFVDGEPMVHFDHRRGVMQFYRPKSKVRLAKARDHDHDALIHAAIHSGDKTTAGAIGDYLMEHGDERGEGVVHVASHPDSYFDPQIAFSHRELTPKIAVTPTGIIFAHGNSIRKLHYGGPSVGDVAQELRQRQYDKRMKLTAAEAAPQLRQMIDLTRKLHGKRHKDAVAYVSEILRHPDAKKRLVEVYRSYSGNPDLRTLVQGTPHDNTYIAPPGQVVSISPAWHREKMAKVRAAAKVGTVGGDTLFQPAGRFVTGPLMPVAQVMRYLRGQKVVQLARVEEQPDEYRDTYDDSGEYDYINPELPDHLFRMTDRGDGVHSFVFGKRKVSYPHSPIDPRHIKLDPMKASSVASTVYAVLRQHVSKYNPKAIVFTSDDLPERSLAYALSIRHPDNPLSHWSHGISKGEGRTRHFIATAPGTKVSTVGSYLPIDDQVIQTLRDEVTQKKRADRSSNKRLK